MHYHGLLGFANFNKSVTKCKEWQYFPSLKWKQVAPLLTSVSTITFPFFKGKKVLAIYFFGPSNSLENVEIFSLAAWVSCHEGFKGGRYLKKVDLPQLALQLSKSWFRALKLIFRDDKGVILMVSCCSKFLRKKTWKK